MSKLYRFDKKDPSSFPRPNMTYAEALAFHREHDDQVVFPMVLSGGDFNGTQIDVTKADYPRLRRQYGLRHRNWKTFLNYWVGRSEAAIEEGRVDPNKIVCPVDAEVSA